MAALVVLAAIGGPALPASSSPGVPAPSESPPAIPGPPSSFPAVEGSRAALRRARSQLRELDVEVSLVAARLHQATVLLGTVRGDLAAARARSARADAGAASAADQFDQVVRWAYEHGGTSELNAVLGLGSLGDVTQGVDLLSAMAGHQDQVARDAGRARERADAAAAQIRSLEQAVAQSVADVHAARTQLQAASEAQRRLIPRLERRLHRTITMAIADRAAAVAAAKEAAAAAAATPSPGDSIPGPPAEPPLPPEDIRTLIASLWGTGPDAQVAECVVMRESSGIPTERNPTSGAAGLFQLMPFWWDGNNPYGWLFDPYDAQANAEHARLLWQAQGWGPWTTGHLCV